MWCSVGPGDTFLCSSKNTEAMSQEGCGCECVHVMRMHQIDQSGEILKHQVQTFRDDNVCSGLGKQKESYN